MALSPDEIRTIDRMRNAWENSRVNDTRLLAYYLGAQRVEQLGMAIPPSMRHFLMVANWPRVLVETKERRQNVRSLILPGGETADPQLREVWDANNLDTELSLFNTDRMVYGRAFMSVGANEDEPSLPLVHTESPREMVAEVDPRKRRLTAACRFRVTTEENGNTEPNEVTLMLPNETVWVEKDRLTGKWGEVDRDVHNLGAVPVVMHLNRRMSGSWVGESEMSDIIPLTDGCARALTNLQFAQEAHGIPRMWMTGVAKGDFIDASGNPIPQWEAYYNAIHTLTNKDASIGQLTQADLKNFETAITLYGKQAATVAGFPARYFGLHTTNPPAEGAIRADESQLIEGVERDNASVGTTLGWAAALMRRFATGEWVAGNRIHVDWFDPATPTVAQLEDALSKRKAAGVLSREGYWDELGWSEARKAKERAYFAAEAVDPITQAVVDSVTRDAALGE